MKCHSHKKDLKKEVETFLNKLRSSGSRITSQRKSMAREIIRFKGPFSAEQLHSKVQDEGVDLVTIYRSLSTFMELELLVSVDFQDGTLRYEYGSEKGEGHHHHIICKKCKKFEPLDFCVVQGQEQIIEKMGYSNVTHKLEFFGLCERCLV